LEDSILTQILEAVHGLGKDMQTVKEDIRDLKSDVQTLKIDVQTLKNGQAELYQLTSAIRSAQELSNAKLDALTMDVRRAEGHIVRIEQKLDEEVLDLRGETRFLNHRIADLEMEVDKLKEKPF
jgi:chromosome segregation ATPase